MPEIPSTPSAPGASANIFQVRVGAGVEYDDNVLRDTSDISDTVVFGSIGLRADKAYGLQRFRADLDWTSYKYNDVSELDYHTFNYNLAWDWSITPRVHGVVSSDRKEYRETFLDTTTGLNRTGLRTERVELAEGVYELGAAWRVLAGVSQTSSKSSQPGSWDGSPEVQSVHLGAGYELGTGTSLTARLRRGDGEYRDTTAGAATGEFDETETDVLLKWPVTAKTAVEGRLGYLDREHSGAPQRDFSGLVGNATVNWEVTGKTRFLGGLLALSDLNGPRHGRQYRERPVLARSDLETDSADGGEAALRVHLARLARRARRVARQRARRDHPEPDARLRLGTPPFHCRVHFHPPRTAEVERLLRLHAPTSSASRRESIFRRDPATSTTGELPCPT